MAEESAVLPVAPELMDSSSVKLRRNSIAKESSGNTEDVDVPHYRRASIGSCHDFCKYGWKHSFEVTEKHSMASKIQRSPISQISEADVNGAKTYVANRRASIGSKPPMKASIVKLSESVNSKYQIFNAFDTNEKQMLTKLSDSPKQGRSEVPITKKKTSVFKLKTLLHRKSHAADLPKTIKQGNSLISAKLAGTSSKPTLWPVRDSSNSTLEQVETSKSIAEQRVETSLKSTIEPVETSSASTIDPVGIPSISMVEPVECSSKATLEPVKTSSILTVEPMVTSSESIMDPVEIPSISIVEPVECSSKTTLEPVEIPSILTVEQVMTSSESIMEPVGTSSISIEKPVGSSSKSREEYAEAASKPTAEPVEALSKSIAKKVDVSSKSTVKKLRALSKSTPKKLDASPKSPTMKVAISPKSTAKKMEASSKSTAQKVETSSKSPTKKLEATSKSTAKKNTTAKKVETSPKSADKKDETSTKSTAKKGVTPMKSIAKVVTSSKSTAKVGISSKSVVKKVVTSPRPIVKNVVASSTSNSMVRTSSRPTSLKAKQMKSDEKNVAPLKPNSITANSASSMIPSEGSNGPINSKPKTEKRAPSLKLAARKLMTPSRASLPPKSSLNNNGAVSTTAKKHKSLRIASHLKNQSKTRKHEQKEPDNDAVEEKTLYVIKMESGNKTSQTERDAGKDIEFSPQSSSSPPKFSSSSQEGKEESECTTSKGKEDSCSVNLEGEPMNNEEALEVKDIGESQFVGNVSSEGNATQMSTLNFRRGKSFELRSEITSPRRLKFRRATGFGDHAMIKDETLRRSFKRRYESGIDRLGTPTDPERIVLRRQSTFGKRDGHGLFNNVIEETANRLAEIRKSKVKALVGAFESIISLQERKPSLKTSNSL